MKKLLIPTLFALTLISTAFASTVSDTKAMDHFSVFFANAKSVSWKTTDKFAKASFTLNNEKVDAFYDNNGEMLGTSKTMAFDKLPKAALETITTKYTFPDYQLKDCIEFTSADDDTNYYVSLETRSSDIVVLEISKTGGMRVMPKAKK